MAKIDEVTIDRVRNETDLVDLIGEHVQLEKSGKNWFGLCPFHQEQSPSFSVSEEKQLYHCFGCGASGNAITFVMELEHRPFVEAVAYLASRIGMTLDIGPIAQHEVPEESERDRQMKRAHEEAAHFYHHILMNTVEGERALQYLKERGFTEEQLETYNIGWSLAQSDALYQLLHEKYDPSLLVEAGLLLQSDRDQRYFDRFRERIMFPLENERGDIVGFSGRIIEKREGAPKYVNSPETPIFQKSEVLYHVHRAKSAIRKANHVILFEGFLDSLAAARVGIEETVAVMGTALSDRHIIQMKRLASTLTICCDGDDAGWEASYRFAKFAMQQQMNVTIALLPDGMDPDDYIQRYGGEQFQERILDVSHSFMSFMLQYARRHKNLALDYEIEQYIHEVLTELAERSSVIERDLIIQQLHEITNVTETALIAQLDQLMKRQQRERQPAAPHPTPVAPQATTRTVRRRTEILLFAHVMHDIDLFQLAWSEGSDVFIDEDFTTLFVRLAAFYEEYGVANPERFAESIEEKPLRDLTMFCIAYERAGDKEEREVHDCLTHLHKMKVEREIKHKTAQIQQLQQSNDAQGALQLLQDIIHLRKSIMS